MRDVHYIALIHKDADSGYGVSFPDVPGERPVPRTLEALRQDADFQAASTDAVVAVIRPSASYYQAAE